MNLISEPSSRNSKPVLTCYFLDTRNVVSNLYRAITGNGCMFVVGHSLVERFDDQCLIQC